jgi:Inosine-uridine nucleoside N-ribohydrolase
MNVIFDCDNTLGVNSCDVDDGLALLYLLGSGKVNLLGITTTYGNSDIETVYGATKKLLSEIGRADIPLLKGCSAAGENQSEAVDFLADTVKRNAGNVSILATGSLTNLMGAFRKDEDFFAKTSEISLMGGLSEPLLINGKGLDELNFSCDPDAAFHVLTKGKNVGIATGNNCLRAYFSRVGYERCLGRSSNAAARYIYSRTAYWYEHSMTEYGLDGFYNWDVMAAVYLLEKDFFEINEVMITPDVDSLNRGFLNGKGEKIPVVLPQIKDTRRFENHVYQTYLQVKINA